MTILSRYTSGSMAKRWAFGLLCVCGAGTACAGSNDDYLKMIEAESGKVGSSASGQAGAAAPGAGFTGGLSAEAFEQELKARYSGTHAFFVKLAPEIRNEIYRSYLDGASYDEVREKIMKRFLQH